MNDQPFDNDQAAGAAQPDYSQPVAYDNQGRPLYAHPPQPATAAHHYVHIARPIDPQHPDIPQDIMRRYEESKKRYPHLNLSKGEYIINAVRRHPIGIIEIWSVAVLLILALAGLLAGFLSNQQNNSELAVLGAAGLGLFSFLLLVGAMVATYVYNNNKFFLTNESVIQEIQVSLFSKHEQTVSLANIEDASYRQNGILPHLLNYGTIRLSTEGDETTYRFSYVANPKRHIAVLNNAVEAFKNGRPVGDPNDDQPS